MKLSPHYCLLLYSPVTTGLLFVSPSYHFVLCADTVPLLNTMNHIDTTKRCTKAKLATAAKTIGSEDRMCVRPLLRFNAILGILRCQMGRATPLAAANANQTPIFEWMDSVYRARSTLGSSLWLCALVASWVQWECLGSLDQG